MDTRILDQVTATTLEVDISRTVLHRYQCFPAYVPNDVPDL